MNEGVVDLKKISVAKPDTYKLIYYIGIAVFFAVLAFFFVPVNDDIFFSYRYGENLSEAFMHAVRYGNGRLLGNFTEILIQHFFWSRLLVIPAALVWVVSLINRFGFLNNKKAYILSFFFIITLSPDMFAGSIHWMAAFCNYVIPTAVFLEVFRRLLDCDNSEANFTEKVLIALFSFAGCLFSENTTLVFVFVFWMHFIIDVFTRKRIKTEKLISAIFSASGFVFMLLLPSLVGRDGTMDSYRHTVFGRSFIDMVKFVYGQTNIIAKALIGLFVVNLVITVSSYLAGKKCNFTKKQTVLFKISSALQTAMIVYFVVDYFWIMPVDFISKIELYATMTVRIFAVAVYYVLMFANVLVIDLKTKKENGCFILAPWLFLTALSILPLIIIEPVGTRLMFMPFVFMCIIAGKLIDGFVGAPYSEKTKFKAVLKALTAASCVICVALVLMFAQINKVYVIRDEHIRDELSKGNEVITIPELPFSGYVEFPREDYTWTFHYGFEPDSVTFNYVPYDEWIKG